MAETVGHSEDNTTSASTGNGKVSLKHASDNELKEWMARRRDRCEVLESVPGPTTADFKSSPLEETSLKPDYSGDDAPLFQTNDSQAGRTASDDEEREFRQLLEHGPLTHSERARLWPQFLGRGSRPDTALTCTPPALLELLNPHSRLDDEDVLFESHEDGKATDAEVQEAYRLAETFSNIHFTWLSEQQPHCAEEESTTVFTAISQLLKYHLPQVASAMEAIACAQDGGGSITSMLRAVCNSCGMAVHCRDLFFDLSLEELDSGSSSAGKAGLLLLCDLVALEGQCLLLPFVVLVLLSEVLPESGCEAAQLEDRLRRAVTLTALVGCNVSKVFAHVSHALSLLNTTPASLLAAFRGERSNVWIQSPMCMVTPEEVLQHTHEGPPGAWRLIAVDARMRKRELSLPVSVRLDPARHSARLQILQSMPDDDAMHLCLIGDGPPGSTDEAFELCLCLRGKGSWRKHVSIVEGGWPAVEAAASKLRLDLMPTGTDEVHDSASSGIPEARAVAAEVAEHVVVATEKVSAAASFAMSGASRALVYLDERWGAGSAEQEEEKPQAGASAEHELEPPQKASNWNRASRAMGYLDGLWNSRRDELEGEQTQAAASREAEQPESQLTEVTGQPQSQECREQANESAAQESRSFARSTASHVLNYLDGWWGAGATEQQVSQQAPFSVEVDEEAAEGPRFRGSG